MPGGPGWGLIPKLHGIATACVFKSSGIHYATWHQPLTWLQAGELPGGTRAGSLLGALLRQESNFPDGLSFQGARVYSFRGKRATGNNTK